MNKKINNNHEKNLKKSSREVMHCVHCDWVSPLSFDPRQIREWNKNIFVLAHYVLSSIHLHNRTQNNTLNKIFFV